MVTNYDAIDPLEKVKRWSSATKEKTEVPQPLLSKNYNRGMGGVDLMDQSVNSYRIDIKEKKWWWVIFTHILNMAVANTWLIYRFVSEDVDLFFVQRTIARHYLRYYEKSSQRSRSSASLPPNILKHEGGHFPQKLDKQLRCKNCHARVRWMQACCKCKVTLCIEGDCFKTFHS